MSLPEFSEFRVVGGTSLSLQRGHRKSEDIDLFTDVAYGSLDFENLENKLAENFLYLDLPSIDAVGMGKSYFIGNNENEAIKLDVFYTDQFVFPVVEKDNIRLADTKEIAAMKIECIVNGGRKKIFGIFTNC